MKPKEKFSYYPDYFYDINKQLLEYFCGKRRIFEAGFNLRGTDF